MPAAPVRRPPRGPRPCQATPPSRRSIRSAAAAGRRVGCRVGGARRARRRRSPVHAARDRGRRFSRAASPAARATPSSESQPALAGTSTWSWPWSSAPADSTPVRPALSRTVAPTARRRRPIGRPRVPVKNRLAIARLRVQGKTIAEIGDDDQGPAARSAAPSAGRGVPLKKPPYDGSTPRTRARRARRSRRSPRSSISPIARSQILDRSIDGPFDLLPSRTFECRRRKSECPG